MICRAVWVLSEESGEEEDRAAIRRLAPSDGLALPAFEIPALSEDNKKLLRVIQSEY